MPRTVRADALADELSRTPRAAVLFTADWCGPCIRFKPHFARADTGAWSKLVVDLSDEDHDGDAWDTFHVVAVPTVVLFEEGREVRRISGLVRPADLHAAISLAGPTAPPPH